WPVRGCVRAVACATILSTTSLAAGIEHYICGICRQWHSGAPHHRWPDETMRSFVTLLGNTQVELPEPNQVFEL
ncbi:MAG TPA: hypothetical protein VFJ59_14240, partial [Pseudolabrys sp.]|nr:hypothetical protein [Pseudolabrys sp.]